MKKKKKNKFERAYKWLIENKDEIIIIAGGIIELINKKSNKNNKNKKS